MTTRLTIASSDIGLIPELVTTDGQTLRLVTPIIVEMLGSSATGHGYASIDAGPGGSWIARADLTLGDGTVLAISDEYRIEGAARFRLHRDAQVLEQGASDGVRLAFDAVTDSPGADAAAWQFFLPSTLYNRNDADGDGVEDYHGTYARTSATTRTACSARSPVTRGAATTFTIARTNVPTFDTRDHRRAACGRATSCSDRHRVPRPGARRGRAGDPSRQLPVRGGAQLLASTPTGTRVGRRSPPARAAWSMIAAYEFRVSAHRRI